MWYNSFRHLVKRSNRIRIQKKLLVLLQEAQLIYVVNFLYVFPLISLPCCPLLPFFFTTLRDSNVPAATSTGGECLQWCRPRRTGSLCCSSSAHSLWESPSPGVLSNHIPSARSSRPSLPARQRSQLHWCCTESTTRKAFLQTKKKDAFSISTILRALSCI